MVVTILETVTDDFLSEKKFRRNWDFVELFQRRVDGK
jgi:hypothetical protein